MAKSPLLLGHTSVSEIPSVPGTLLLPSFGGSREQLLLHLPGNSAHITDRCLPEDKMSQLPVLRARVTKGSGPYLR